MDPSAVATSLGRLAPVQLRSALASFLPTDTPPADRIRILEKVLRSPLGQSMRDAMARWIVDELVPVKRLVPISYLQWREPVRDSMMFVIARLSPGRLAPKLLEQLELPFNTSPEARLLRLIAKVPGLQKLGQVIARNQHLRPALRRALARLENGIRDVQPEDIRAIIEQELGSRVKSFDVKIAPVLLSEASVSAVVRFTWRDPVRGRRQRGVFKVIKPHIPEYFAEDMDYLQGLSEYFGDRHRAYGFPPDLIPDTFRKVRRLLQHEVNFAREQKTLVEAAGLYHNMAGVRVPQLIKPLCSPRITALTEERGIKVTNAAARLPQARRLRIAQRLIEAVVAVPLLSARDEAVFHGDPHAGNLLYNPRTDELTILDWALRERLNREQRRQLALLFLMVSLRDPLGTSNAVLALSQSRIRSSSSRGQIIQKEVARFLDELPLRRLPSAVDAMQLLEQIALKGIKFPGPLVMLSKVMFTLDGILRDVSGAESGVGLTVARHVAQHWLRDRKAFRSPLRTGDWITLQCSALLLASRLWLRGEQAVLDRVLPAVPAATVARTL
ncbi:MAG TPA: AarF/UbiB family protein [Terriglobales bacterium]|jgi:ubiquinone biosynthesis protein